MRDFVSYWAKYVQTHSDKEWGKQLAVLVDAGVQSGKTMSVATYKKLKGIRSL